MRAKRERLKKSNLIFIFTALPIPILQFIIFYIFVNANSVVMAFQKTLDGVAYNWNGFNTLKSAVQLLFTDSEYIIIFKNTFILYFSQHIVIPCLVLVFALSIWKKIIGHKLFSIVLFLPSMVSSVVFVMIARTAVNSLIPSLFKNPELATLFNVYTTGFMATTIFTCLLSFGNQLILQLGAMAGIDRSVVEYGQLDGVNGWQEFRYIVFPHIWPTLISLFVIGVASIFTNQGMLISFFGAGNSEATVKTLGTQYYTTVITGKYYNYPILSAMGVILTVAVIFVTFTTKHFLEKLGPSED